MLNRDYLGYVAPPTSVLVEAGQLRLFCKAIGETRDIYLDEDAAKAAGHRSIPAPPTFGTCLSALAPRTGASYDDMGLDYRYLLHGEEGFTYHGQIYAGDTITMQDTITDMYERKGGRLEFMVRKTTLRNQFDELVAEKRSVLVMRKPPEAAE